jgi:peptide/nickel transport system permease protein
VILTLILLACVVVPLVSPYDSSELVAEPFQPPSRAYPFGTDSVGRDLFVRVWAGGRLDLAIAALVVGLSFPIGTLIGIASGASHRAWLDTITMRFLDAIVAFPFIILILALIVVVGRDRDFWLLPAGAPAIIVAILLVDWSIYARLARTETRSLRSRDFVTVSRMLGYRQSKIIRRDFAPGVSRITASYAIADFILVIVATASLAFLGAGVQPPAPEWGNIMFEGRAVMETSWWITVIPGLLLALTGLAVSLIADALLRAER